MRRIIFASFCSLVVFFISCKEKSSFSEKESNTQDTLLLNYKGTPNSKKDDNFLVYTDQGAWFGFSLPSKNKQGGFSGPFLMTQENGVWSSKHLVQWEFLDQNMQPVDNWGKQKQKRKADLGQLKFEYTNENLKVMHTLFFANSNTAVLKVRISNISNTNKTLIPVAHGRLFSGNLSFHQRTHNIEIQSDLSKAIGHLVFPELSERVHVQVTDSTYQIEFLPITLLSGETYEKVYSISFLFTSESWSIEKEKIIDILANTEQALAKRMTNKKEILHQVTRELSTPWNKEPYLQLVKKLILTLQNNWRSAAGGLHHDGLFPSYRSSWFQGFWAWDSWKQAAAIALYNPSLAKDQVLAMYDYMTKEGFIPDAIFRNNRYEENNYRNTKPPLSGWAVWKIYQEDKDIEFVKSIYPKIKKQHQWWYIYRDHDSDGICEYGSTDGSLTAAKWGSGMDNAVRFDDSEILKNSEMAFSLNQESVDLNSYLYAEKIFLAKMAEVLGHGVDMRIFLAEADRLKQQIQTQFYDEDSGWFYDSSLDGQKLIKVMGPEGWIPLWANIATKEQAKSVHENIMNPKLFNTKVPFPTLNASHKKFEPQGGYWRGPVWIDQAYFGVRGLKNYGYVNDANKLIYKLIHNAEGVLTPGKSIRENYNPVSGKGLESRNFSWSAAHYLLMLLNK